MKTTNINVVEKKQYEKLCKPFDSRSIAKNQVMQVDLWCTHTAPREIYFQSDVMMATSAPKLCKLSVNFGVGFTKRLVTGAMIMTPTYLWSVSFNTRIILQTTQQTEVVLSKQILRRVPSKVRLRQKRFVVGFNSAMLHQNTLTASEENTNVVNLHLVDQPVDDAALHRAIDEAVLKLIWNDQVKVSVTQAKSENLRQYNCWQYKHGNHGTSARRVVGPEG